MKISLDWLKEYVDYNDSVECLVDLFTNVGFPVEEVRQVGDDWMLDVEITSNRPDCLGHIGLAREIAAATGAPFHLPDVRFGQEGKDIQEWTSIQDEAPDLCARYTARIISDVTIGPSPDWMQRRLETIGLRGISNVVDITNYVLMEIGQPLHSFDYDKLREGRIIVRLAQNGEQMEMIDHSKIELTDKMLVIADAAGPVALAGVMGGLASEVSDATRTILLESAHFDPLSIRRTSRTLTLSSESSFRFERNVDMEMLEWASRRATALLVELAGGRVAPGLIDVGPGPKSGPDVTMRLSRLNALVGIEFERDDIVSLFERLGLAPRPGENDTLICTIPSWRGDLIREVDLIEEVIRIHGYDRVPTEPKIHITVKTSDPIQRTRTKVRTLLNGCGFHETINVSFIEDRYWTLFAPEGFKPLRVKDYARRSNNALRPSLLPSLLETRKRNQDAGNERCDFYELAAVHYPEPDNLPQETINLALCTDGDFREVRGVMETVLRGLDREARLSCRPTKIKWADQDAAAELLLNDKLIGHAGQVSEAIIQVYDLDRPVCMAEIDFDALIPLEANIPPLTPIPRFPSIIRDLSLVLDETVSWEQIEQTVHSLNLADLTSLHFVDIYRGKGMAKGKKSLTLSLVFRRAEETLRHEQVDEHQEKILEVLDREFQAQLRG